jgi:hypothetical protein
MEKVTAIFICMRKRAKKYILFGHVYFVAWPSGYCVNLVRVVCVV